MKRDFVQLFAMVQDDKDQCITGLALAMGVLIGADVPGCAMAVLLAAERAFPNDQASWDAIRTKVGLEQVVR